MLPGRLGDVVDDFQSTPREMRLELLLEYSERLTPLPPEFGEDASRLERVVECQTPFFLALSTDNGVVHLHFDAPPEAPTVRGFAGILQEGLDGTSVEDVIATPLDLASQLALNDLISPLRLRGMSAVIARLRRQAVALEG